MSHITLVSRRRRQQHIATTHVLRTWGNNKGRNAGRLPAVHTLRSRAVSRRGRSETRPAETPVEHRWFYEGISVAERGRRRKWKRGKTPGSQSKFMRMGLALAGASVTQECRQSRSGKERKENEAHSETRTDSVQKVCGGI